jgi:hypothetical protein
MSEAQITVVSRPLLPSSAILIFSNPTHCLARQIFVGWKDTQMKLLSQFGLVSVLASMIFLVPANAFASRNSGTTTHPHTETVHDRTPTVHTHDSHPHHHG